MNYDIVYAHSQPPAIPFKECVVAFESELSLTWLFMLKWAFIMKLIWDHYNSSKFKRDCKQFKVNMDTQQNEILSSDTPYKWKLLTDVKRLNLLPMDGFGEEF